MQDGKYSSLVTVLVLVGIVSVMAALGMLRSPSTFQPPISIANLLRRPVTTSATPAPASAAPPGQPLTTPAPASPRVAKSRIDVGVPPSRGTEVHTGVETPPIETPSVQAPAAVAVETTGAPELLQSSEIHSAADRDVTPPKATHPQQFGFQRFDLPTREIVTFELIIDEQGRVESTRVMSSSPTLAGTMLYTMALQATRSWDFEPALKAGTPVKFRYVISFFGSGQEVRPQESR